MSRVVKTVLPMVLLFSACGDASSTGESPDTPLIPGDADAHSTHDVSATPGDAPAASDVTDALPSSDDDTSTSDVTEPTLDDADAPSISDVTDTHAAPDDVTEPPAGDTTDGGAADSVDASPPCPPADPLAEAIVESCNLLEEAVVTEALDVFPSFATPALLTLTDQVPVEPPGGCISDELPQSTDASCMSLTATFKLEMFADLSAGKLAVPPAPDTLSIVDAGTYTFWAEQCAVRAIEMTATRLGFLGGCTDDEVCCPNVEADWLYLRGVVVGAAYFGQHLAAQLEAEGLPSLYPPPTGQVPICQDTAMVSLASAAALATVDEAAAATPVCPGFTPDGVAETLLFGSLATQYLEAIKLGVNTEAWFFSARLMEEGPCCMASL
jgi:hypothetical protein